MLAPIKRRAKRSAQKRRLTELSVRKAKPRTAAYLVWDTHQRGLALQVQPTGAKAWKVIYSRHGRPRWLTLGAADAVGLSDARTMAAEAMLAVAKGGDPAADKRAERSAGTFAELAGKYVEQYAKKHNKSWTQADALVSRFAIPKWGKLQPSAITRSDIRQMMERITAPIVANQTLAAVSAIFSWGFEQEIVAANPCKGVARNPTRSRERILSDSELVMFWRAFGDLDPARGAALKMILLTGQRPGEIASMRREHVVDHWWRMPGEATANGWPGTKNKANHDVWLSEPVQALLAERLDSNAGNVFGGLHGDPITGLDAAMRSICTKLSVEEKVTPHDLRRTFGTIITKLKFGRDAMNRILNHSTDDEVGDVYDRHSYSDEDKHIMEVVAAHIMAVAEGREDNVVLPFGRKT